MLLLGFLLVFSGEVEAPSARKSNVTYKRKTHPFASTISPVSCVNQPAVSAHSHWSYEPKLFTSINNLNATFKITCRFRQVNMEANSLPIIPSPTDAKHAFPAWWLFLAFSLIWHFVYHSSSQKEKKVPNVKKKKKKCKKEKQCQKDTDGVLRTLSILHRLRDASSTGCLCHVTTRS